MRFIGCLMLMLAVKLSFGQNEMETDRPDQTECSSVIPVRTIQVETGGVYTRAHDCYRFNYPTTLIRIGLLSAAEFRLIIGEFQSQKRIRSDSIAEDSGFRPLEMGAKISVCQEKGIRPEVAFLGHLAFRPFQTEGTRHLIVMPDFRFSLSHTISPVFSVGYNLGMEWTAGTSLPAYVYTATAGAQINVKLYGFIEVFGNTASAEYPECYADGGFSFQPIGNLQLDISGGLGLNDHSDPVFLGIGLSFRLPH